MATIPGASGFVNAATLANRQGLSAQRATLLGNGGGTQSLLDAGRSLTSGNGIGLSSNSRALTNQLLSQTAGNFNKIFSLGLGISATIEGAQTAILALRAGLSDDQLARSLRVTDDGGISASNTGSRVNTQA